MAKKETKVAEAAKAAKSTNLVARDLRDKDMKTLTADLLSVRKDLGGAQRSLAAGELVNPQVIRRYKKDIARIQTVLVEKARTALGKEDE